MKKYIAAIFTLLFLSACSEKVQYSYTIEEYGSHPDGLASIDPDSVRNNGDEVMARFEIWPFLPDGPTSQKLKATGSNLVINRYGSVIKVNCKKKTLREVNRAYTLSDGSIQRGSDTNETDVLPQSPGEDMMNYMCKAGWKRAIPEFIQEHLVG